MTKENIEKIMQKNVSWDVNDISPEEKKDLAEFLSAKGFTASTFYLRFFQKGFDAWEIQGIKSCKSQFLAIPAICNRLHTYTDGDTTGEEANKKSYLDDLAKSDKPGAFYAALKMAGGGSCMKFFSYMEERGMSRTTIIKRFSSDDWKPWEVEGIRPLLEEYMKGKEK